ALPSILPSGALISPKREPSSFSTPRIEGIFVSGEMQSQGIGKILLNYAKDKRNKLHLNVYQKNARAISFYKREGFEIQHSGLDEATGEKDYVMTWQHK
ncbi:GNAT family N-acetyltransferase, partial [Bifidobacterium pseudocatenulatum]|uniref:GNAT family N-acetyltransferase n=1 Tax=Bifidobacterium pseudocatenulatum TaxID=28026 RepID=UPI0034A13119